MKLRKLLRKLLGIETREERKKLQKKFIKIASETKAKFDKLHSDTLKVCSNR